MKRKKIAAKIRAAQLPEGMIPETARGNAWLLGMETAADMIDPPRVRCYECHDRAEFKIDSQESVSGLLVNSCALHIGEFFLAGYSTWTVTRIEQ